MESLMMRDKQLYGASVRGDIQSLNELLKEDKFALYHYGSLFGFCFNETPLHIAATRGHVDFAKVLLQHKPDLVNELDSRLRAPLHLASANGQVEMVKLLLDVDSDVCLIEDEFGRTPLHLAAMVKGRVEVVNELVRARPEAIMYPLNRTKTLMILHSYVIRNGPKALEPLVEVDHTFLNSQDGEGNTILHKVVALKKLETLKYLVSSTQLVVNLKNQNSFTALDIIEQMPRDLETNKMRELLVKYGALNAETLPPVAPTTSSQSAQGEVDHIKAMPVPVSFTDNTQQPSSRDNETMDTNKESWLEKKRDAILIAATVIAGMAYQAGLNPPGGVWDHNGQLHVEGENISIEVLAGTSILAATSPSLYIKFWAFNTTSFIAALSIVLLLIGGPPRFGTTWFRVLMQKVYMGFVTLVIWVTSTTMALTYLFAMEGLSPWAADGFREIQLWSPDFTLYEILKIGNYTLYAWLGFICIAFLFKTFPFFVRIGVELVKRIKRSCKSVNEGDCQGHRNANTSACLFV